MLTVELQNDRQHAEAGGPDKARLRAVANLLDKASKDLTRAVERAKA